VEENKRGTVLHPILRVFPPRNKALEKPKGWQLGWYIVLDLDIFNIQDPNDM